MSIRVTYPLDYDVVVAKDEFKTTDCDQLHSRFWLHWKKQAKGPLNRRLGVVEKELKAYLTAVQEALKMVPQHLHEQQVLKTLISTRAQDKEDSVAEMLAADKKADEEYQKKLAESANKALNKAKKKKNPYAAAAGPADEHKHDEKKGPPTAAPAFVAPKKKAPPPPPVHEAEFNKEFTESCSLSAAPVVDAFPPAYTTPAISPRVAAHNPSKSPERKRKATDSEEEAEENGIDLGSASEDERDREEDQEEDEGDESEDEWSRDRKEEVRMAWQEVMRTKAMKAREKEERKEFRAKRALRLAEQGPLKAMNVKLAEHKEENRMELLRRKHPRVVVEDEPLEAPVRIVMEDPAPAPTPSPSSSSSSSSSSAPLAPAPVPEEPLDGPRAAEQEFKKKFEESAAQRQKAFEQKMAEMKKQADELQREHELQESLLFYESKAELAKLQIAQAKPPPPPPPTPKRSLLSRLSFR